MKAFLWTLLALILLLAPYGILLGIDGLWAAQDHAVEAACYAALRAEGIPEGQAKFHDFDRVCPPSRGLLPNYRFMRDECFDFLADDRDYCRQEMWKIYSTMPSGSSLSLLDIPCGRRAMTFCEKAFPPSLWR